MRLAILKNEFDDAHLNWAKACVHFKIDYQIIDLVSNLWLSEVLGYPYDCYLACPPGREEHYKKMYDERIEIIEMVLGKMVYPNYQEIRIHENKKYLSYWLMANSIPHPKTFVFYSKNEALRITENIQLPVVGKMNIGASGKGVRVFRDREMLVDYIIKAYSSGLRQDWGPNLKMGDYRSRMLKLLKHPNLITKRLIAYRKNYDAVQIGFVILQEYIEHNFEWRVIRIGDSYFGHKKVKQGEKASGTKGIIYDIPPVKLLDFVYNICNKHGFNTMAVDLFEDGYGGYLVNELQCIFGHVQDYVCERNGKPGRFIKENGEWKFQEGSFNNNLSYNLRLENLLTLIK